MTGREKIEAALTPEGTAELPAVICYEGIYIRDRWDDLTDCPWWYQFSPDLDHQMAWRREVARSLDQDWFFVPGCGSREERERVRVEERPGGVFRVDEAAGEEEELTRPPVAGASPGGALQSRRPERLADTTEEIDAFFPAPEPFDPDLHDAVMMQPSAEVEPGTVIEELRAGYRLKDRVIRPAQVIVSKTPDEPQDSEPPAEDEG